MAEKISEAEALAAQLGTAFDNTVNVRGKDVTSEPLTIDQIARIMLAVDRLASRGILVVDTSLLEPEKPAVPKFSYTQLALRGGADFIEILAIATEQSPAFIGSLNLLEVSQVAGLVFKVQKDFFVQNQTDILLAFGLDQAAADGIKDLFLSLKSLLISKAEASPTSADSPSPNSAESASPSPAENMEKSLASPAE